MTTYEEIEGAIIISAASWKKLCKKFDTLYKERSGKEPIYFKYLNSNTREIEEGPVQIKFDDSRRLLHVGILRHERRTGITTMGAVIWDIILGLLDAIEGWPAKTGGVVYIEDDENSGYPFLANVYLSYGPIGKRVVRARGVYKQVADYY